MRRYFLIPLLLVATSLLAQPVITGIAPTEGPTSGGTEVTITGSGFEIGFMGAPLEPIVYFDDMFARSTRFVNETTLVAVAPAHLSGSVAVRVSGINGSSNSALFTYVGSDQLAVERFLLPVFTDPISGGYGAEFRIDLTIWNASIWDARIWGFRPQSAPLTDAVNIRRAEQLRPVRGGTPGSPGRFIDVSKEAAQRVAMNLRAYDTSRSATNFGTELPVVRLSEFQRDITLTGVPLDPRYRVMVRVYGEADATSYSILTAGGPTTYRPLSRPVDAYDPSYAEHIVPMPTSALPPTSITISAGPRVWAFVTVTNNETQHITTITPQPSR